MSSASAAGAEAYAWVKESVLRDAGCVTLVRSGDQAAVALAFGGDPGHTRPLSLVAAANLSLGASGGELAASPWMALRPVQSWLLAVEVNGWQGSRPEVLSRVSAGTLAVSAYWNVNGTTRFSYAAGGRLLATFDAVFPDRRAGDDPDCLEELRAGLPWDQPELVPVMLALAARITGLAIMPEWFDGNFDVVPVEPLPEAVQSALDPDIAALTYEDPPIAWALRHAGGRAQRDAAYAAARYAADVTGVAAEPVVQLALREQGDAAAQGALGKLLTRLTRAARASGGGDPKYAGRWNAVTALREAASLSSLAAGFNAVAAASYAVQAFGMDDDGLRADVLAALGSPRPPAGSMGLSSASGPRHTDRYAWTAAHWLAPVGAITFIRAPVSDVVRMIGADHDEPETGIPRLFADPVIAIRAERAWSVAFDSSEWLGPFASYADLPDPTLTITWSARGRAQLHYSADRRLLAHLDPQAPDLIDGDDPAALTDHLHGLRLGPVRPNAAACLPVLLVLAERITGVSFDPASLDTPHTLVPRPPRYGRRLRRRD